MTMQLENIKKQNNDEKIHFPERRRTVRVKRTGLLKKNLEEIDRPALKIADELEELVQAFKLVHDVYLEKKFLPNPKPHGMLFNVHSLLPDTTHFIAKSYKSVLSNLTGIYDSELFGLPMDSLYKEELDQLRDQNKSIMEVSALATPRNQRWKQLFMYLMQLWYWYSIYKGVDEVCIVVNPRHKRFYRHLLSFEQFGPVKHYERVNAPAVPMKVNLRQIMNHMIQIYNDLEFDADLYEYFYRMTGELPHPKYSAYFTVDTSDIEIKTKNLTVEEIEYFLNQDDSLLNYLSPEQKEHLFSRHAYA